MNKEIAEEIYEILAETYPNPKPALDYTNVFEFLIATVLSAQTTDKQVNKITPKLFEKFPDAEALAHASEEEVEKLIYSTGFYKSKAKGIVKLANELVDKYDGEVPNELDKLVKLPRVGRKSANVILGNYFSIPGIVVDTHVKRLSYRMDFTKSDNPDVIEKDLEKLFDKSCWVNLSNVLIYHGRNICDAKKPQCATCPVNVLCIKNGI